MKILPLGVYLSGLGCLLLCDVLVTARLSGENVALWAEIRSIVGLSSVLCLLGLEQVFIRSPKSSARLLAVLAVQVPILSIAIGGGVWISGFLSSWFIATLVVFGAACSGAFFQYYRSHHMQLAAQLSQQLWKIFTLVFLLIFIFYNIGVALDILVAGVMVVSAVLTGTAITRYSPNRLAMQAPEKVYALYSIGLRFAVTSFLLSLAIYGEQLLVNRLGGATQGAIYFTHATYFIFPASVLSGYFSFVIGPWARDNHDRYILLLKSKFVVIVFGTLVYVAAVTFVGWAGWIVVGPMVGELDYQLLGLFFLICFFRTLYVWPGAYVGIFGQPRQHDILIVGQVLALFFAVLIFYILIRVGACGVLYGVAVASAFNWLIRVATASVVIGLIEKARRDYG